MEVMLLRRNLVRSKAIRSWEIIEQSKMDRAIDGMPARLQPVIDANGQKARF